MSTTVVKKWIYKHSFEGFPKESDFELVTEEQVTNIAEGEILCEALYLSVDPYMRLAKVMNISLGAVMVGQQIARVTMSKHADWPVGTLVVGLFGWRTHTVVNVEQALQSTALVKDPYLKRAPPELPGMSPSLTLGALGIPGVSALLAIEKILQPSPGDVFLVTGAAGATGSIAGQIAKIKGCKVIGSAGTDEKCDWLKELGFDHVFNYKKCDMNKELSTSVPGGIDCFFDNVGGEFCTEVIVDHMKAGSRIASCGSISTYNTSKPTDAVRGEAISNKKLKFVKFHFNDWHSEFDIFYKQIATWIQAGRIQAREHVTEGIESTVQAFIGLFTGENIGKAIVKIK